MKKAEEIPDSFLRMSYQVANTIELLGSFNQLFPQKNIMKMNFIIQADFSHIFTTLFFSQHFITHLFKDRKCTIIQGNKVHMLLILEK